MKNLEKSIKRRYILFISTIILIIISVLTIIQNSINYQKYDTYLINKSGKQRMLSQSITKMAFSIEKNQDETLKLNSLNSLKTFADELEASHNYLYSNNKQKENNAAIDSLLKIAEPYLKKISTSSRNIINNADSALIKRDIKIIAAAESSYSSAMDAIVKEYQKVSEKNLQKLIRNIYFLALIAALILIGEFLFILMPAFKKLILQNDKLTKANNKLAHSESKIKEHMSELTKLKTDLEIKDSYNKVFIEQAPTAIAMLDKDMKYMAVSQRWIADYKMEGQEIIGRSHYDIFPEIGDDWRANHQKGLKGAIDICDEAPFTRADGSVQWIYWDVRPWYISEGNIGGLIMHTGDITHLKQREEERIRIEKILDETNEVARIGTWDIDLIKNEIFWSRIVREIHEVPENYKPDLETAIHFFKEGKSRDTINKAVTEAIEHGTPYDVEIELVTAKNNIVWTRAMGQAEIVNGKCVRIFGVFQDVNEMKLSQLALNKAHTELKAIFNSKAVAIVSTDIDGIIRQFNHGAEILTGYAASEIIGLQRPAFFHLQEELDKFRIDIAKKYGKNPVGFSAQLELSKHNAYDTREWHYLRKDGSTIPVLLTLTSIKDEQGELIGFLGVSTDVSDRRAAQDELLRKNQLLNFAEEITLMGNWQWDTVADKVQWSKNLYNIFKLDIGINNLNFDTYFNFVHPDDKEIVTDYFNKTVDEKSLKRFTHRIIAGDGKLKFIQLLGEVITNDKDEVIEMIGTCQDITAIKAAERELYEANLQLRAIFNSGPIAIVSTNNDGIINHFNSGAETLLGYSASEMIGLNPPEIFHIEEEIDQFRFDIAKLYGADPHGFDPYLELAKRNAYDTREWTYRRKDGSTFPVQLTLTAIKNDLGEKIGFLGVSFDITERRKTENELLRKNQLLTFAEEITMMGNWQWDITTNDVKWSANLFNIFGLEENTALNYDTYFRFVHPEDQERVTKHVKKSLEDKKFIDLIHRIKLTDGTVKTIQLLAEVITDNLGSVIEMIGTCQDITEQKMAENKFRGLLESAPDAMVIVNNKGEIQLINKQSEKLFGYSAEELFGKPVKKLIPERFEKRNAETVRVGDELDSFAINKEGKEIPVQVSFSPLQTEEGLLISAAIRDITAQKLAENELLRKNQLLNLAEKITMMGNWQSDIINNTVVFSTNFYRILGLEENTEATFNSYLDLVHPEDKDKVAKHQQESLRDKKFTDLVHRIKLKDGTVKIVLLRAELNTDKKGNVTEVIGTCQDVTAQRMAENKFRGLLESAPDAMVIVNEKREIQLINKQAEVLFGYSAKELFGKEVDILIPERFSSIDPKTKVIEETKESFALNKKGENVPVQISFSPLQTEEGLLISAAIRDITEQKLSESKIIEAKERLEVLADKLTAQNSQLADFAHITSHNLRAPVSNLNSLLEFYNESESVEEKGLLFQKFEVVIGHLTLTLNTLVEAIKTQNDNSRVKEDIMFDNVLRKTSEILSGEILKTDAIIESNFTKAPKINYDKIYLESIFLNLLSNSIKYKSNDRTPKINIETVNYEGKIKLTIKDNGLGINLDRHGKKIFGLNKVFHRHPDAKGVGLYMTKIQIEAMGGTITVSSKVNKGTMFTIFF